MSSTTAPVPIDPIHPSQKKEPDRKERNQKKTMSSPSICLPRSTIFLAGVVTIIIVVALLVALLNRSSRSSNSRFFRNPTSRAYYHDQFDDDRGCIPNPT